jgi:hypothetical protein
MKSYLHARVNCIELGNDRAQFETPIVGVPQGSVLGPFLFNLYVNDFANAIQDADVTQYADDTVLIVKSANDPDEFSRTAGRAIQSALKWFKVNQLEINIRKTSFMIFGNNCNLVTSINVGNDYILRSELTAYLGLRLESCLKWRSHINFVVSRTRHFTIMLTRSSFLFDRQLRIYLCKTLIFPIINVYCIIYGSAPSTYLSTLNVAYNNLMRRVLGVRRSQHLKVVDMCKHN